MMPCNKYKKVIKTILWFVLLFIVSVIMIYANIVIDKKLAALAEIIILIVITIVAVILTKVNSYK